MIPLTVPALGIEEISAVERVLRSGMLVQGKEVEAFEAELCRRTSRKHAVAVANGTVALELALRVLGIGPADEVLCPNLTWPSPAHAIRAVGATVVLVDVDPSEWNVTAEALRAAVTPRTKAAIVIDQFGNPARHAAIAQALPGLALIVDAACSLGSSYQGAPCGSHGIVACTSFHPRKVLTTGEGGALFLDDDALDKTLRALRNHGQAAPGSFVCASGNARLTEMAAAMGRAQLEKLDALCAARRRLAARVFEAVPSLSGQRAPEGSSPNHQTLGVLIGERGAGSAARDAFIEALSQRGVQAGRLSYALHTLPQFAEEAEAARRAQRDLSVSADIAARGLALPLFPGMSEEQLAQLVEALLAVVKVEPHGD